MKFVPKDKERGQPVLIRPVTHARFKGYVFHKGGQMYSDLDQILNNFLDSVGYPSYEELVKQGYIVEDNKGATNEDNS